METARIIISINMIMSPIPLTPLLLFYVMWYRFFTRY
nr:MAG TPA: hypothetical protein [Caudoviricetes sp.]